MEVFNTVLMDLLGVFVGVDFEGVKMGGLLSRKSGQKSVCEFYTEFYTFCQHGLETPVNTGFVIEYGILKRTFNPLVTSSNLVRPTTPFKKTSSTRTGFFLACCSRAFQMTGQFQPSGFKRR